MEKQDATKAIRVRNQKHNTMSIVPLCFLPPVLRLKTPKICVLLLLVKMMMLTYILVINPNFRELIDKACALEGTEDGYATATGMAAVYASIVSVVGMEIMWFPAEMYLVHPILSLQKFFLVLELHIHLLM